MLLAGSCHCQAVTFTVNSRHPYPYNICYCSICRKTAGGGGFTINLNADYQTLVIQGAENITRFHAQMPDGQTSNAERSFCKLCGTALWLYDSRWPSQIHPQAAVIDTPLPRPPEHTHLMLASKPGWVDPNIQACDKQFDEYPDEGIAAWHQRLGLEG